jgi:hypothetical protein
MMLEPIRITLTGFYLNHPTRIGRTRQSEAERMDLEDQWGFEGDGEEAHILGAKGEQAHALAMGLHWEGTVNTFRRGGDVWIYQTRTRSKHWYDLPIRDNDDPTQTYVCLTSEDGIEFCVWGWWKGLGKSVDPRTVHPEWRQTYGNRPAAWFVPKKYLSSIKLLVGYNRKKR